MANPNYNYLDPELESALGTRIFFWAVVFHILLVMIYFLGQIILKEDPPKAKEKDPITFELVAPPGPLPPAAAPESQVSPPTTIEETSQIKTMEPTEAPDELQSTVPVQKSKAPVSQSSQKSTEPALELPKIKVSGPAGGGGNILGGYIARAQYLLNQAAAEIVVDEEMDEDSYVELSFEIKKDGSKSVKISKSSGESFFDRLALRAAQQVNFPPLPVIYDNPTLVINLKIRPQ